MPDTRKLNVLLYPYHTLPSIPEGGTPPPRAIETAAALLYFDSVTLGRPGTPEELDLPSPIEAWERVSGIKKRRGAEVVRALNQGAFTGLTVDEIATLNFVRYWYDVARFHKEYGAMLEAGVVRPVSLAAITEEARLDAKDPDAQRSLNMKGALSGFIANYHELGGWPRDGALAQAFAAALGDADGAGLAGWYLRKILSETDPVFLLNMDRARQGEFFHEAFLMDVHHQALLSTLLDLPVLSFDESHLELRANYVAKLSALRHREETAKRDFLAVRLMAETLTQIPAVMPRSPEAILELRYDLAEELDEFRYGISNLASDLIHSSTPVATEEIEQCVNKNLTRPLDKLTRRLAHPNRDLLRHLAAAPAVVTGVISFTAAVVTSSQNLLSLLLGVSTAALTAAVKAKVDRVEKVEDSGVAFLIKAAKKQ